jgi:hypothetical protein
MHRPRVRGLSTAVALTTGDAKPQRQVVAAPTDAGPVDTSDGIGGVAPQTSARSTAVGYRTTRTVARGRACIQRRRQFNRADSCTDPSQPCLGNDRRRRTDGAQRIDIAALGATRPNASTEL